MYHTDYAAILTYFGCLLLPTLLLWFGYCVLHEGGHALAALLLGRGPVTVFLGTFGQRAGTWALRLGRVQLYTAYNIFWWRGGYCECPALARAAPWRQLVFILAGPLLPVAVAGPVAWVGLRQDNLIVLALTLVLLGLTGLGTLFTLLPRPKPSVLADGRLVYNDGQAALNLLRRPRQTQALNALLRQAEARRVAGDYAQSADLYAQVLARAAPTRPLLAAALHVLFQAGRYAEALAVSTRHRQEFADELTAADQFGHALLLSRTGQHQLALAAYSALIELPVPHPLAYSNRGYTHNLLGHYALALSDFDQALAREGASAYVSANRGLALLKLGEEAAGLAAIQHSLTLDPASAYAHRNLGIYYLDRGEAARALTHFEQARHHDPATHQLAEYMQQARQHLEMTSGASGL